MTTSFASLTRLPQSKMRTAMLFAGAGTVVLNDYFPTFNDAHNFTTVAVQPADPEKRDESEYFHHNPDVTTGFVFEGKYVIWFEYTGTDTAPVPARFGINLLPIDWASDPDEVFEAWSGSYIAPISNVTEVNQSTLDNVLALIDADFFPSNS